jgi:hypothetical protein
VHGIDEVEVRGEDDVGPPVPFDVALLKEQAAACLRVDLLPLRKDGVLDDHAGERGSRECLAVSQERRRRSCGVSGVYREPV